MKTKIDHKSGWLKRHYRMVMYPAFMLVLVMAMAIGTAVPVLAVPPYITVYDNLGGDISPDSGSVGWGSTPTYTIEPDDYYIIDYVEVDSVSQGRLNSYTFAPVSEDHTIEAFWDGGWTKPTDGSVENIGGSGGSATTPDYDEGYDSDDSYVVFDYGGGGDPDRVRFSDFGFSIPTTAGTTIDGIEVAVEGNQSGGRTCAIELYYGATSYTSTSTNIGGSFTSSDSTVVVGGSSDQWGRGASWTPAEINSSNFGVRVEANSTGPGDVLNLDQVQMKVYYTEGGGGGCGSVGPIDGSSFIGGTALWTNAGNILFDDGNVAYVTLMPRGDTSCYLMATDFDFSIPSGATINGIEVRIREASSGTTIPYISDLSVRLIKDGDIVGKDLANTGTDWPGTETPVYYGGITELWDESWSESDIEDPDFGAAIAVINLNTSAGRTASIDDIEIRVRYNSSTTTSWHTPDIGVNESVPSTESDIRWHAPGRAETSNNSYAYANLQDAYDTSAYLRVTGFNFDAIPDDANIVGIVAEVEKHETGGGTLRVFDNSVKLIVNGEITGDEQADTVTGWPASDPNSYVSYGADDDTWGETLSGIDVKSNFGVAISAIHDNTTHDRDARIDHVRMTVYYCEGGGGCETIEYQSSETADSYDDWYHLEIDAPADIEEGNFLIAGIVTHYGGPNPEVEIDEPDGWTLHHQQIVAESASGPGTYGLSLSTYYKVAGGSEPSSYVWDITPNDTFPHETDAYLAAGGISRYTGVDPGDPIDDSGTVVGEDASAETDTLSLSVPNDMIVAFFGAEGNVSFGDATDMNEHYEEGTIFGPHMAMDDAVEASTGTWGPEVATISASGTWISQVIALKPYCEGGAVNHPPDAVDDGFPTPIDVPEDSIDYPIDVLSNDSDPDMDPLEITAVSVPTNGSAAINDNGTPLDTTDDFIDYSPDANYNGSDSFTYDISDGNGGSDTATVYINVTPVNDAPVISGTFTSQTVQYSDKIIGGTIIANDIDSMTLTLSGLPSGVTASAPTISGSGTPADPRVYTWTISEGPVTAAAGTYDITVSDGDGGTVIARTITVTHEDATVTFDDNNDVAVEVATEGGNSGPFSLTAVIKESYDGSVEPNGEPLAEPGDICLALAEATLVPVGPGGPESPISGGAVSCEGSDYGKEKTYTWNFNNVPVNTYVFEVTVTGNYYTGGSEDVLVVYDPSLGFTTGGGWFYWPGTYQKTNFGYTMKYNKKATKVQGSLLLIRHNYDGSINRIKSNALYGLALNADSGWASFAGKCTYMWPVDGEQDNAGNNQFLVYVEDHGEPGAGVDQFWFTMLSYHHDVPLVERNFTLDTGLFDHYHNNIADWDELVTINGGNIFVPHTPSHGNPHD